MDHPEILRVLWIARSKIFVRKSTVSLKMFPTCNKFRKTRNLVNFFIVSNVVLEMAIYLFAHFLFYSHPSFVDGTAWNRWGSVIPILTLMYLNINGKKNNIWLIIIIISHTLPVRITLDCDSKRKLESKTKRS